MVVLISLHADPSIPPGLLEGGGTHSYVKELMLLLTREQIPHILLTRKSSASLPETEKTSQYGTIYRLKIHGDGPINKKLFYQLRNEIYIMADDIISQMRNEVTVIHSVYWNSGQLAMTLSQKYSIPYVHTVISNGKRRRNAGEEEPLPVRFAVEQEVYEKASYIFCITQSEKEDLIHLYDIDPSRLIIPGRPIPNEFLFPSHNTWGEPQYIDVAINHGNDKQVMKIMQSQTQRLEDNHWWLPIAFTYFGRIAYSKGIPTIVSAWLKLWVNYQTECPSLWLVGGTPSEIQEMRDMLKCQDTLFEQAEHSGKLIWWGYLNASGISALLLKSIAVVTHSKYEPGGRVIIEALSEGIPVLTTPNGFGVDCVEDWVNGFVIPYGKQEELYQRLQHFIWQPYLCNSLGIQAEQSAKVLLNFWDFYETHKEIWKMAQLALPVVPKPFEKKIIKNNYKPGIINIYSFPSRFMQKAELVRLVNNFLPCDEGTCIYRYNTDGFYDELLFENDGITYIAKHYVSTLNPDAIVDPFASVKAIAAHEHFTRELEYLRILQIDIKTTDESSCLLIHREMEQVDDDKLSLSQLLSIGKHTIEKSQDVLHNHFPDIRTQWLTLCRALESSDFQSIKMAVAAFRPLQVRSHKIYNAKLQLFRIKHAMHCIEVSQSKALLIIKLLEIVEVYLAYHDTSADYCIGGTAINQLCYVNGSTTEFVFSMSTKIGYGDPFHDIAAFLLSIMIKNTRHDIIKLYKNCIAETAYSEQEEHNILLWILLLLSSKLTDSIITNQELPSAYITVSSALITQLSNK